MSYNPLNYGTYKSAFLPSRLNKSSFSNKIDPNNTDKWYKLTADLLNPAGALYNYLLDEHNKTKTDNPHILLLLADKDTMSKPILNRNITDDNHTLYILDIQLTSLNPIITSNNVISYYELKNSINSRYYNLSINGLETNRLTDLHVYTKPTTCRTNYSIKFYRINFINSDAAGNLTIRVSSNGYTNEVHKHCFVHPNQGIYEERHNCTPCDIIYRINTTLGLSGDNAYIRPFKFITCDAQGNTVLTDPHKLFPKFSSYKTSHLSKILHKKILTACDIDGQEYSVPFYFTEQELLEMFTCRLFIDVK